MDLYFQWAPQSFIRVKGEVLKNGAVDASVTVVVSIANFGDEITGLLDGWYLSDDGEDVYEFKLTVENLGAIMPLEWGIEWEEVDYATLVRTSHSYTLTLPDGGPVSHNFTPAGNHYSISTDLLPLSSYKCPA